MEEISNIEDLLKPNIQFDIKVKSYRVSRLTAPGENYGSLMLAVEVKILQPNNKENILHLVAKKIPENQWLQEMFQVQHTFEKEAKFYSSIIPTLIKFQVNQGVENMLNFFPRFFGARKNLNNSSKVDDDGVLLLENLKYSGYITMDRIEGFNLEITKFLLNDLAIFHAVPLAMKLKKPEDFENRVLPYIPHLKLFEDDIKYCKNRLINKYDKLIGNDEECRRLYSQVKEIVIASVAEIEASDESVLSTIIHNDYWVNNTMLKFSNGKPVSNKIVDFQVIEYGSLARDLLFFLFSSVQVPVVEEHYQELIEFYYERFVDILKKLNCDVSFLTFEVFENELNVAAKKRVFFQLMFMLKPILASPHQVKDLKDLTVEDLDDDEFSERQIDKCCFTIKEFRKRNWI